MADSPKLAAEAVAAQLCVECGLCCDGTLFKDVELQEGDCPEDLKAGGISLRVRGHKQKFAQPCAALSGCECRIYADRPSRCRQFECLLFQSARDGRTSILRAQRVIREARQKAARARRLLRELGDANESVALSVRFRRMRTKFERGLEHEQAIDLFGELTIAVHALNLLLSQAFYNGNR